MSRYYDKENLKAQLGIEQIFDLFELWGGEPEYVNNNIVSQTICHNLPGEGSRKLYYYANTNLCHCYTGCGDASFDIFDLCIKVMKLQKDLDYELYDAMLYIASYFGLDGEEKKEEKELEDWVILNRHKLPENFKGKHPQLQEYNPIILTRFLYPRIKSWEDEGISPQVSRNHLIGYYPGQEQITIPHYNIDGQLIGIRGRFLAEDNANRYGKYLPLRIGKTTYNHPLSMNLYNINWSAKAIRRNHIAIVFESEKSSLKYSSIYGQENDISLACCGSSLSKYQFDILRQLGIRELILAFDRDFSEIGDEVFHRQKSKILRLGKKYGNIVKVSTIWDKDMILGCKSSPIDEGKEKFEILLRNRLML